MLAQEADDNSLDRRSPLVLIVPDALRGPLWKEIRTRFSHVRILAESELVEPYEVRMHKRLELQEAGEGIAHTIAPVSVKEATPASDVNRRRSTDGGAESEAAPRQPR
ncbi:MAG: hypothetical protein U0894_18315 [Pirellulales bacterium]